MTARLRWSVPTLVSAVLLTTVATLPTSPAAGGEAPVGSVVRVAVSVATLWVSPDSPRPIDRPALRNPAKINRWINSMSTADRRALVGRVETQALYGERLRITGVSGTWLHVVALRQPTHRDSRGYPGWVPARQVAPASSWSGSRLATVVALTTRLRPTDGSAAMSIGFGTRLPVLSSAPGTVTVRTVGGVSATVASGDVVVSEGGDALPSTRRSVLRTARSFVGVPYLWGGRSGFAVDCSGFTELVYDVHGVRLPRDADDQYAAGRSVSATEARRGDLAFFWRGSSIGHVGFVAGDGRLLHAPGSGEQVHFSAISDVAGLAGYRRFA